jgi:hypothetical protein
VDDAPSDEELTVRATRQTKAWMFRRAARHAKMVQCLAAGNQDFQRMSAPDEEDVTLTLHCLLGV